VRETHASWKDKARRLRTEVHAVYLASRHPAVPWYAKALVVLIVAYALSPIDLIPDFIPVLGYLDDLILVPAGIALAIRLIPPQVLEECRQKAAAAKPAPRNWIVAAVIVGLWIAAAYGLFRLVKPRLRL
jgi:uncharacterized membrane protein YkvA (DUF1232 family)